MRGARSEKFAFHTQLWFSPATESLRKLAGIENAFLFSLVWLFPFGFVTFFYAIWEETQQKASSQTFV